MGRKHKLDEVLNALTAKGCVITGSNPITKQVNKHIMPSKEAIKVAFDKWVAKQPADNMAETMFSILSGKYPDKFASEHHELFSPKTLKVSVTIQEPYCINVNPAGNSLGNGSWGKIDYLCKVHGYRVVRL